MSWPRAHPYASAIAGAAILLAGGFLVVRQRSAVAPNQSGVAVWQNAPALPNSYAAGGSQETPQSSQAPSIMQEVESAPPYTYVAPAGAQGQANAGGSSASAPAADSFDFNAFIASLSQENAPKSAPPQGGSANAQTYAYIPQGLVSAAQPSGARTPLQEQLYEYGNEAGSYIQSFENAHMNEAQVLAAQIEDRGNPEKAAAVVALGEDLERVGANFENMRGVPAETAAAHEALAQSYVAIGQKLALVPQARSDGDFLAAIKAYDASANVFVKNYVALANLFGAYGVAFGTGDPGSVFLFTQPNL